MAHRLNAIVAFRPRIKRVAPAESDRYMQLTTARTTLSSGVVKNVQETEVETLIGLLAEGRRVDTGTASYSPSMDLDGRVKVHVRVDPRILNALNAKGAFRGAVVNAENVGKSQAELTALWNEAHPDDPIG